MPDELPSAPAASEYPCIRRMKVVDLIEHLLPDNPRVITAVEAEQLKHQLDELGNLQPITYNVRTEHVISGNQRADQYAELGVEEVDVWCVDLSEEKERQAVLALNNHAGRYDDEMLKDLLDQIGQDAEAAGEDRDLALVATGFTTEELAAIVESAGAGSSKKTANPDAQPQIERAGELQKEWGTATGQVWALGPHKLICGDSTDAATVLKLLGEERPNLMVTDPPYGVNYDPQWRLKAGYNGPKAAYGTVKNDDTLDWEKAWALFKGNAAYIWHAGRYCSQVQDTLERTGLIVRAQIIWNKSVMVFGRGNYHWKHEPCWYCVREDKPSNWQGDRKQTTVWDIDKPQKSETGHSTQKPIECMARPIRNNSAEGDLVYEPFSGSGTTIIACETLGRICRAIELSPGYVAVNLQRYLDCTGVRPTLLE